MKQFIPFSRYDRKPEFIRQMPSDWYLEDDKGDILVGRVCIVCAIGLAVLILWGVA